MSEDRFSLYRLCECATCEGRGKVSGTLRVSGPDLASPPYAVGKADIRCEECRGEGRVRQEVATCATAEAVGVAIVTLGREGEWTDCAFGLLDREPPCERCDGSGQDAMRDGPCSECQGSGVKPTGTWLVLPWLPSARNVRDAARTLARSKGKPRASR